MARAKKKEMEVVVETVKATHPLEENKEPDSISIEATAEIFEVVNELRRLEELKKRLLELEETHKQKIMHFMGQHQQLKYGYFTLASWKAQTRRSFDSSSFKTEFADLYDSYLKEINVRVFRLC
jgi:hypothetical protein